MTLTDSQAGKDPFADIVAPATPPGRGPRAVLRCSGPEVFPIFARWTSRPLPRQRRSLDRELHLFRGERLPVRLQCFPGPASYTGEDLVELHVPSSPLILALLLVEAQDRGLRPAEPGEFTRRAFTNGKLDLAQAEAIQALIRARDESALEAAQAVLAGEPGLDGSALRDELCSVLALLESGLDFEEDETGEVRPEAWRPALRRLRASLAGVEGRLEAGGLGPAWPALLLIGPPNAGKTSLWNALRDPDPLPGLVSDRPGTTRDLRWAPCSRSEILLGDLPGMEEGDGFLAEVLSIEQARSDGWIWVEPAGIGRRGPPPGLGEPTLALASRSDAAGVGVTLPAGTLEVSVRDGTGLDRLQEILTRLGRRQADRELDLGRLHGRLLRAAEAVDRALAHEAPELVAAELHEALADLDPAAARALPEAVLDRIFARFCLGK